MPWVWAMEGSNLSVLGADPDNKLVQALGIFKRALTASQAEADKERREEDEAKNQAKRQAAKMIGRHG